MALAIGCLPCHLDSDTAAAAAASTAVYRVVDIVVPAPPLAVGEEAGRLAMASSSTSATSKSTRSSGHGDILASFIYLLSTAAVDERLA